jgi:hypothetical protein
VVGFYQDANPAHQRRGADMSQMLQSKIEKLKKVFSSKPPVTGQVRDVSSFLANIHDPNVLGKTMKGLSQ